MYFKEENNDKQPKPYNGNKNNDFQLNTKFFSAYIYHNIILFITLKERKETFEKLPERRCLRRFTIV